MANGVLLIDDDPDLRASLEQALEDFEIGPVLSFGQLKEAQAHTAEALQCACAVLDVNLGPRQPTGIDAASWLRDQGFTGRIVFLTGHAGSYPTLKNMTKQPRTLLLEKPATFEQLLQAVTGRDSVGSA
jgi:DNA-binding NtrC family response regulator